MRPRETGGGAGGLGDTPLAQRLGNHRWNAEYRGPPAGKTRNDGQTIPPKRPGLPVCHARSVRFPIFLAYAILQGACRGSPSVDDPQLLHPIDQSRPRHTQPRGGAIATAYHPPNLPEDLRDMIALSFSEGPDH